jgi:uncharacterized membrane protein YebE (DUF533 family)
MEDRGGVTANHFDHVHASYAAQGAGTDYTGGPDSTTDTAAQNDGGLGAFTAALTNGQTWVRVLMFLAGAVALVLVAQRVMQNATA